MKILVYTSPARGHLYPVVPVLRELVRRGHEVVVHTLSAELARVRAAIEGARVEAVSPAVEGLAHDDYEAKSPAGALDRGVRIFVARAEHEIPEMKAAVARERPGVLLVDFNAWGASAVAEASGLPWALYIPYLLPWKRAGVPPFGPGLAPRDDVFGRVRDAIAGGLVHGLVNRNLPALSRVRAAVGLPPLRHMTEQGRAAPLVVYFTAEPFEYASPEPLPNVVAVGPSAWEPELPPPAWLDAVDRPVVLVTCSTEYQRDDAIVRAALEGLAGEDVFVVATTAAVDPASFDPPPNARVERFVPHSAILPRAACVVCHGGMGITQKALASAVPVCVVPFGRDQLETARRVEVADAGVRLPRSALSPVRLRDAVRAARTKRAGAARVAEGFRRAGGAPRAADAVEALGRR